METPPAAPGGFTPDRAAVRKIVEKAVAEKRQWLTDPEAKAVIAAYGVPTVMTRIADTPEAAAACAAEIGGAVVVKIRSPDITHKSDLGGVALDLSTPGDVRDAAQAMLKRISQLRPDAKIQGFSIEPMVHKPHAIELIVCVAEDAQFGPLILFGHGGTAVEVMGDRSLGLPPLNMKLARDLMARTRIYKQLQGYRSQPPADLEAIAFTLVKVSQLVIDVAEIAELDINPLQADENGVIALDARIRLGSGGESGEPSRRLAIRPYPSELEETATLPGGENVFLRPVRPEDEPAIQAGFTKLTPEDVRMRFFASMKTLPHDIAARLTQIDYDREMALIAFADGPAAKDAVGAVRLIADPDNRRGEYSVIVRSDFQRRGLGRLLMERIVAYARRRGIGEIFGYVLEGNGAMLKLCEKLGFAAVRTQDRNLVEVRLLLCGDEA